MVLVKILVMALTLIMVPVCAFVTPSAFTGRKEALLTGQGSRVTAMPRTHHRRGSTTMVVIDVGSTAELDRIVLDETNTNLIVVDYSTTWCGPCKLVLPAFEKLSETYKEATFLKVIGDSTNEATQLMKREGVRSVPSFHFWKGGKKVDLVNGANEAALMDTVLAHV